MNNPFNLITDEQYGSLHVDINNLWSIAKSGNFKGVDGINIEYKIFKNPKEIGAVVISSGRTESYIKYKELVFNLYRSGYTVYIHDHRGQGFSGRMTEDTQMGHVWNFDDYVVDLKKFHDDIVSQNRHRNLFLLAHSMGGGIATLYIEKYQKDFKAAALSSPMHQPDTGILGGAACTGAAITTTVRDFFIGLFNISPRYAVGQGGYKKKEFKDNDENLMTHDRARFEAINALYEENEQAKIGGVSSHWLSNACKASSKLLDNAAAVNIPVLVLQAENDIAVTAEGQNRFCSVLESTEKPGCKSGKPIVIPGAYHEMFIESDEYRIPAVTEILQFFQDNSS